MATTSTVPTVKTRLVTKITTALNNAAVGGGQIPVFYAWPGADAEPECVFLGPHPATADIRLDISHDIPTIKAARKQRQEDYTVRVTVWTFRPELSADGAEECETRAFVILGHIEDELADDTKLGLTGRLVLKVTSIASTLFPFSSGWACELGVDVSVSARLS